MKKKQKENFVILLKLTRYYCLGKNSQFTFGKILPLGFYCSVFETSHIDLQYHTTENYVIRAR